MAYNPYKKIVVGFDSMTLSRKELNEAEDKLIENGFSIEHNNRSGELVVYFDTKAHLDIVVGVLKLS